MTPLQQCLVFSSLLFAAGLGGVLARRDAIVVLMGIELMLNAANINFVAFSRYSQSAPNHDGYLFVLFSIAIAAAESAVGLALVILLYRRFKTTRIEQINELKE